jgi:hypothetical protein
MNAKPYEAVRVSATEDATWSIDIDSDVTLVEVAAIMGGIGCRTQAEHIGGGAFRLTPIDAGALKPTGEQIRDILEHGISRLPFLIARRDLRSAQ